MAGIYYDLAPHLVHHALHLFGLPESVENNIYFDRENSIVDDHFEMILHYKDGFKAFIGAEMLQRDLVPKIKLIGTNKTYAKYDFDIPDSANYPYNEKYQVKKLKSELIDNDLKIEEILVEIGKHYLYYENLSQDILNNVSINNEDTLLGLGVVLVMEKGMEAYKENKRVLISKI
jgi:scyllo-inositol 2-dehydrogenase (NADP+)